MTELRPEERIVVRNSDGDEAVVVTYRKWVPEDKGMLTAKSHCPRMVPVGIAELRTEDGREVYAESERVFMIVGERYEVVRREKIA